MILESFILNFEQYSGPKVRSFTYFIFSIEHLASVFLWSGFAGPHKTRCSTNVSWGRFFQRRACSRNNDKHIICICQRVSSYVLSSSEFSCFFIVFLFFVPNKTRFYYCCLRTIYIVKKVLSTKVSTHFKKIIQYIYKYYFNIFLVSYASF